MHQESLRKELRDAGVSIEQTHILTVTHREVAKYLAAADLGILGRGLFEDMTLVNQVSSPIKFGEYLASGTPVVLSEGIGDFSNLAARERVGVVLPSNCDERTALALLRSHVESYRMSLTEFRARCQRVAREQLDIRRWVGTLMSGYERLWSAGPDRRRAAEASN
jgi:hypothetical protein